MREVRGVRSAAAARMSLAKAKSEEGIELQALIGLSAQIRLVPHAPCKGAGGFGLPCRIVNTLSRGPSATNRPLLSLKADRPCSGAIGDVEMMIATRSQMAFRIAPETRPHSGYQNGLSAHRGTALAASGSCIAGKPIVGFWPPDRLRPSSEMGMSYPIG